MNPSRRKKSPRQLWSPEDLGLVPLKYVKRKAVIPPMSQTGSGSTSSSTPSTPLSSTATTFFTSHETPIAPTPNKSYRQGSPDYQPNAPLDDKDRTGDPQTALLEFNRLLTQKGPRIPRSDFVEDWKATMLRAEHYDVVKAVTRCSRHWNIKSDWFGTPDLKTIIRDLAPNLVQKGYVQLIPVRDCKGRAVVCLHFLPNLYSSHERELKKYIFYMLASVLEDVETQDNGISLVVWNTHDLETANNNTNNSISTSLLMLSPTKLGGGIFDSFWSLWRSIRPAFKIDRLHYCTVTQNSNTSNQSIVQESQDNETLIRQYSASPHECLHAMLTYGIPVHALPVLANQDNAPLDTTWHLAWADWRQKTDSYLHLPVPFPAKEHYHHQQHQQPHRYSRLIMLPCSIDILMGGYGGRKVHPGNVIYHQYLQQSLEDFSAPTATAAIRTTLCRGIYLRLEGRCLQPLDPHHGILWEVMSPDHALGRIQTALEYLIQQQTIETGQDLTLSVQRRSGTWNTEDWDEWLPRCCTAARERGGTKSDGSSSSHSPFCNWKMDSSMSSTLLLGTGHKLTVITTGSTI